MTVRRDDDRAAAPRWGGAGEAAGAVAAMPPAAAEVSPAEGGGDAPAPLGPLAEVLGYQVAQAAVVTTASFERHVGQPLGLRKVEYSLLLVLLAAGPQTPKRLGRTLVLSAPNLTMLVDRLQDRGLLRRERSTTDRRSQNLVLTEAGRELAQRGVRAIPAMEADTVGDRLSPVERLMLIELLRKLCAR